MRTLTVFALAALVALSASLAAEGGNNMELVKHITWLGHDTFKIKAGSKVIYTDPFQIASKDKADIILVTHEHRDHCSADDLEKLIGPSTVVVAPEDCKDKVPARAKFKAVKPGDKLTVEGVEIEAVPAYNTNKKFHPKEKGWVGYIFKANGVRIYHAGDTDVIPEMKDYACDVALLPISGTYTMTADEAAEAAQIIKPKVAVPMHYGAIVGSEVDAARFAEALKGKIQAVVLPNKSK